MPDKDGGWVLPEVINPETRTSVCICIPDEQNHVMAFWGALRELAYWFNWQRNDAHDALPVSILWREIVDNAHQKWLDGVMCTSCDELIACLQPLMDEINAKLDALQVGVNTLQFGAGNSPAGQPLSPAELAANQAGDSNPTCDRDVLWAQCLQLVQYTNQLIVDALEAAEAATNNTELVQIIAQLPGLDEAGADAVAGYVALLQDGIAENYIAEYTESMEQGIACLIFCTTQVDCEITIEKVNQVYHDKVGEFFVDLPTTFATLANFLSYFVDQNVGSDSVVYVLHYLVWAGGALANLFLGDIGTKSLQTLLLLAVNDANDDWTILCDDCPPVPEELTYVTDPTTSGLTYDTDGGLFGPGARWINTPYQLTVTFPDTKRVTHVRIRAAFGLATGVFVTINGVEYTAPQGEHIGGETYDYDAVIPEIITGEILVDISETRAVSHIYVTVTT